MMRIWHAVQAKAHRRVGDRLASETMLSFYAEKRNWRMNGDRFFYRLGHHGGIISVRHSRIFCHWRYGARSRVRRRDTAKERGRRRI